MSNPALLGLAAGLVLASSGSAAVINVGPGGSIQTAINGASDGDEIILAPGTYNETINFLGKAITVRSSDPNDPAAVMATIIDGQGFGNSVITCGSGEGPNTVLSGVVITGGNAGGGGGMLNSGCSPTVINCTFTGNSATLGGGGMYNRQGSSPLIINCIFDGNLTKLHGGGVLISDDSSSPTLRNCIFINNVAASNGGGIAILGGNPTIVGCTVAGNTADFGGGVYNNVDARIVNCLIVGNEALFGGAMFNDAGFKMPFLLNCTLVDNTALVGGGVVNDDFTILTIWNSVLWGNSGDQIVQDELATSLIAYSNISPFTGVPPGPGNISASPEFVDPVGGDYRLQAISPMIDAGHNWAVPSDSADLDNDGDSTELTPLDLDGNPRFTDDVATTDTGCGGAVIVDMGAYEFPGNALSCLRPGDVNGDRTVNVLDLIDLLLAFGASCDAECCPADFDLSGTVNVLDLIDLLLAFGQSCP